MSDNEKVAVIKGSNSESDFIQNEIEIYTKKIEHEKINARLAKERFEKQISHYMQLQGMPVPFKSKEQKEKEKKEKKETKKKRKPLYESKPGVSKRELIKSNPNLLEKNLNKNETEMEKLTNEINGLMLENRDLKKKMEDLRKEKNSASFLYDNIKIQSECLKSKIDELLDSNREALNKIKFNELDKVKDEAGDNKKDFASSRDGLEEKFHHIIEENIRRERDNKKEMLKKRSRIGSLVSNDEEGSQVLSEEQQERLIEEEDISDRTPILDVLIEKWKFYNKYKKGMLERYIKNASSIRDAFDKMMKYLGIDDFQELPIVLEKMEDQMSSIEIFISQLTNQIDLLEDTKKSIDYKIKNLKYRIENNSNEKQSFKDNKQGHIFRLKTHIAELKDDIEKKRNFFVKLQPDTDNFLSSLGDTYISDFIPKKVPIIKDLVYNESNIIELIANVEDYEKLIEVFDKSTQTQYYDKKDILVNKDIEKLKNEMRSKLELFKKDNYIGNEFYSAIKGDAKINTSFDETIKKMADSIVRTVNHGIVNQNAAKKKK